MTLNQAMTSGKLQGLIETFCIVNDWNEETMKFSEVY